MWKETWLCEIAERIQDLRDEASMNALFTVAKYLDDAMAECRLAREVEFVYLPVMEDLYGAALHLPEIIIFPAERVKILILYRGYKVGNHCPEGDAE